MVNLNPLEKATLSVQEFADVTETALSTAYSAVQRGDVASIRIGGRIRIPTSAVRRLLQLDEPSTTFDAFVDANRRVADAA